jgi:N-acetylglutamate synthase-like GNAT family acetyltransferase
MTEAGSTTMNKSITIRRATDADRPTIQSLFNTAGAKVGQSSTAACGRRAGEHDAKSMIASGHYFLAEREGRVVAVAGWEPHAQMPDTAVVRSVFVHRAHNDRAAEALGAAETNARLEGYDQVLIPATPESLRLYTRH